MTISIPLNDQCTAILCARTRQSIKTESSPTLDVRLVDSLEGWGIEPIRDVDPEGFGMAKKEERQENR